MGVGLWVPSGFRTGIEVSAGSLTGSFPGAFQECRGLGASVSRDVLCKQGYHGPARWAHYTIRISEHRRRDLPDGNSAVVHGR